MTALSERRPVEVLILTCSAVIIRQWRVYARVHVGFYEREMLVDVSSASFFELCGLCCGDPSFLPSAPKSTPPPPSTLPHWRLTSRLRPHHPLARPPLLPPTISNLRVERRARESETAGLAGNIRGRETARFDIPVPPQLPAIEATLPRPIAARILLPGDILTPFAPVRRPAPPTPAQPPS